MGATAETLNVTRRELAIQSALLIVPVVVLFPAVFFLGEVLAPGGLVFDTPPWSAHTPDDFEPTGNKLTLDALVAFHMYYTLAERAFDRGEWPLWNRYEFAGIPLLANYQSAVFYPTRLLHRFLDIPWATTIFILINVWLCGFNAYLCGRGIGLAPYAARFLSFAWMLCSYCAIWVYWPVNTVAAWVPIVFLGAEWILTGKPRKGFFALALGAVLLLLAGHPETAFAFGINFGLYFVLRLATLPKAQRAAKQAVAVAAGAWALALCVCMAQLLPFIEYLPNSQHFMERPGGDSAEHAVQMGSVINMFVPRFYGVTAEGTFWGSRDQYHSNFTNLVYPSIAVWLAAALAFTVTRRHRDHRLRVLCLALPAVLSFLAAFHVPILRPLLALPVFSSMWYLWHVGAGVFGLSLIAAHGIQHGFAEKPRARDLAALAVPLLAGSGLVAFAYFFNANVLEMEGRLDGVRREVLIAAGITVAALALFIASARFSKRLLLANALVAVLAVDLVLAVRSIHPTSPREHIFFETETTNWLLNQQQPVRTAIVTAYIPSGFLPVYGIEQTIAYDGILPLRFFRAFEKLGEDFWRKLMAPLGVQFVLHDPRYTPYIVDYAPDDFVRAAEMEELEIWEYQKAFPRAWLVDRTQVVETPQAMLDAIRSPEFDPASVAYVESPIEGDTLVDEGGQTGTAFVTEWTENTITLSIDANRDAILILAEAYYPGWDATVNGETADIFPVFSILRGVRVPAGESIVQFSYDPMSFRIGLTISAVALVVSAVYAGRRIRRRTT
jgi:hypothetical protein